LKTESRLVYATLASVPARIIDGIAELENWVGREVGVSDWFLVTQTWINRFAELTDDHQWIHVDPQRAAADSPFHSTIAHGFLTLAMLSEFSRQAVDIRGDYKMRINYGINRLRFPAPVPAGASIRGHFTLQALEKFAGGTQIVWNVTVEVLGSPKPALAAEWVTRVYD
jgi:acyl dehydratase